MSKLTSCSQTTIQLHSSPLAAVGGPVSSSLRQARDTNKAVRPERRAASKCEQDQSSIVTPATSLISSAGPISKQSYRTTNVVKMNRKRVARAWTGLSGLANLRAVVSPLGPLLGLVLATLLLASTLNAASLEAGSSSATTGEHQQQQKQQTNEARAALEAELNSLLRQHDDSQGADSSKLLSEAIISRLMLGNLSDSAGSVNLNELLGATGDLDGSLAPADLSGLLPADGQAASAAGPGELDQSAADERPQAELSGPELMRLRKMLGYLHNYELTQATSGLNNGQAFNQFPVLPASQAATIKRASVKMGNYLRQQQQHGQPRQVTGYNRNNFDFGLGKRPDASVAGNILRFGDSAGGLPVSGQFGKRPSAHRYDFGLGKRVASPTYPRYDFGLGKRAPSRIRYDFGLGRR